MVPYAISTILYRIVSNRMVYSVSTGAQRNHKSNYISKIYMH